MLGNTKIFLPSDWFGELLLMTVAAPPPTWRMPSGSAAGLDLHQPSFCVLGTISKSEG